MRAGGPGWELRCGRYQDVLADVETCDAVITDPPYSARTHEGHGDGARSESATMCARDAAWASRGGKRRPLNYVEWTPDDVRAFVSSWAPRTKGWLCAQTSHDLCPDYTRALEDAGRCVFAPLPLYSPGSRIRLAGDGPSSWTCWMVVARPRHAPFSKWGTLPGGYVYRSESMLVVGGKPLDLMRAIIRDYTRPGDLVVDPCAGGGTTLLAAAMEGRRAIGAEMDPATFALARARLERGVQVAML